jgi:hypothetical protein
MDGILRPHGGFVNAGPLGREKGEVAHGRERGNPEVPWSGCVTC